MSEIDAQSITPGQFVELVKNANDDEIATTIRSAGTEQVWLEPLWVHRVSFLEGLGEGVSRRVDAQGILVDVVSGGLDQTLDQIPAEERVLGALLIVDPADRLVVVFTRRIGIRQLAAWIGRHRQFANQGQRRLAEEGRIDTVADERSGQADLTPTIAGR